MCGLSDARTEPINRIISECSNLAQKDDMSRHDWARKMIYWKLGNSLRNVNLTIQPDHIFPKQNQSWRMRRTKFSEILGY